MREIGVGLLGFGTVGAGVVRGLQANGDLIADRLGVRPVIRKIADIDLARDRGVDARPAEMTADAVSVVDDPAVEVVVELIGGTGAAWKLIERSLKAGKPVVTANKALLAAHGEEIFRLAAQKNTDIYFGASVGGCIPIVRALREGLIANHIESIHGILNGTSNYILTRMEAEGLSFDRVLADAQEMGYAEADPGLDIDGWDTAHKAVILASLAYGLPCRWTRSAWKASAGWRRWISGTRRTWDTGSNCWRLSGRHRAAGRGPKSRSGCIRRWCRQSTSWPR